MHGFNAMFDFIIMVLAIGGGIAVGLLGYGFFQIVKYVAKNKED